jgi:hypothetical protein
MATPTLPRSWNLYSAFVNPLVVLAVSILLITTKSDSKSLPYLFPLVFLATNSLLCAVFWALRLSHRRYRPGYGILLVIGYIGRALGWIGILTLTALALGIVLSHNSWSGRLAGELDWKFWAFWGWAILEAVHHHVYKLQFGARDTLQYIVAGRNWSRAREPLGGAIGIHMRKLKRGRRPTKHSG